MTEQKIDSQEVIEYLEKLLVRLKSDDVEDYFMSRSKEVRDQYLDYRFDIKMLVEKLTLKRLKEIQDELNKRAPALIKISQELDVELEDLKSTRKILERVQKIVTLASRFALILL